MADTSSKPLPAVIGAVIAAIVVIALGVWGAPRLPSLSAEQTGNSELAAEVKGIVDATDGIRDQLSAAVVTDDDVMLAGFGADENTEFEVGSVTKTMTALLLAQAVERGDVALDTQLGELLDLGDSESASVTLGELASHRSGLPRIPTGLEPMLIGIWTNYRGADPYPYDLEDLLNHARDAALEQPGTVSYSNLGFALLGQALAQNSGISYAELVQGSIFDPLGMDDSYLPVTTDGLNPEAPTGYSASGKAVDAWTMGAYAPAGGIRSTAVDMSKYTQALLTNDENLGADAAEVLDPRWDDPAGGQIGLAWNTQTVTDADGRAHEITWHNGITGGFWTMLVLDSDRSTASFVVGNTSTPATDEVGIALLLQRTAS